MKWKKYFLRITLITVSILTTSLMIASGDAVAAGQLEAKKVASIEYVKATGDGSATELYIKLSAPAVYTSYKTSSPLRLVFDFSQVTEGAVTAPVVVNKGNFKTVTASRFDSDAGVMTRIEVELAVDSEALILSSSANPGELKISFPTLKETASTPVKQTVVDKGADAAEPKTASTDQLPSVVADSQFRTLTGISVNNSSIVLALDGAVSDFKTFRLNNPERYVVDLMNVRSGLTTRLLPLNASGIASARIGLYPDKLRVVLDSMSGSFPEAYAVKSEAGVIINLQASSGDENVNTKLTSTRIGKPAEQNVALTAVAAPSVEVKPVSKPDVKPAISAEPKPEPQVSKTSKKMTGSSSIDMIDFQVVDGISRVSVKINGDINAEQPVKSAGYVTLTIKNSTLPKKLQRSIETRSFESPILRITPLSVKTSKGADTKIRIATRVVSSFEFRQEGDVLYVDFKHPEGLSGDKLIIEAAEPRSKPARQKVASGTDEEITDFASPSESVTKSTIASRNYKGRKVTLEFADADVRKIFQLLSEVSGKNFVLGDDVTGNISLKLVNVPWDQALDIILDTKDLDLRESGNVLTIKKKGKFKSQADEENELKKSQLKNEPLHTEYFSVNYSKADTVKPQLEALLTKDIGKLSSDERTNTIIVTSVRSDIERVKDYLARMDVPEKQVMIEARIVEATSTFSRSLGVSWGVHSRDGSAALLGINAMDTGFGGLTSAPPTAGVGSTAGGNLGISFGTLASNIKLDTRLSAAASAGMIKIISSPKVATLNNKAAKISQGQQIPYQNTTATTGAVTAFVAATLSLEVTPHINANGTIVMKIDAKNDAPGTGSPPPINTKQATTELLLKDGETTVIGGIYVDSEQEGDDGVPYLMDIPFIGYLFKSNTKTKTKTELLIFITPRILGTI